MFKKISIMVLIFAISISSVACSNNNQSNENSNNSTANTDDNIMESGSNKRGGQAKLERIQSGVGRGTQNTQ